MRLKVKDFVKKTKSVIKNPPVDFRFACFSLGACARPE